MTSSVVCVACEGVVAVPGQQQSVVLIYADDLGHGCLGCYGQRLIPTPNIDRLAALGMRFTNAYGCAVCAPARASLSMGIHDAHSGRWTFTRGSQYSGLLDRDSLNRTIELLSHTGMHTSSGTPTIARIARDAGMATMQIGKLEWGFATTPQHLAENGWDHHFGYYDHGLCHGYYPPYLWQDGCPVAVRGNTRSDCGIRREDADPGPKSHAPHDMEGRAVYSQDLFDERVVGFLRANRNRPFFLYHPTQLPHGAVFAERIEPEIAALPGLNRIEQEYAGMVTRLDRTVGLILDELIDLGIADRTLVIFASDNGHAPSYISPYPQSGTRYDDRTDGFRSMADGDVFDGNGGLAGIKKTNWEGGCRVPLICAMPGRIPSGTVSDRLTSMYDVLPTVAELTGQDIRRELVDGVSMLPELSGKTSRPGHEHVVFASYRGPALVRSDGWKLRTFFDPGDVINYRWFGAPLEYLVDNSLFTSHLYNLTDDPDETDDLAAAEPGLARRLLRELIAACDGNLVHGTPNAHFAFTVPDEGTVRDNGER